MEDSTATSTYTRIQEIIGSDLKFSVERSSNLTAPECSPKSSAYSKYLWDLSDNDNPIFRLRLSSLRDLLRHFRGLVTATLTSIVQPCMFSTLSSCDCLVYLASVHPVMKRSSWATESEGGKFGMNDNPTCDGYGGRKGECEDLTESLVERRQTATIETRHNHGDAVLSVLCIGHASTLPGRVNDSPL